MKNTVLILIMVIASAAFSQNKSDESNYDVRVKLDKPTIYLEYICQNEKNIFLRMYNNTIWQILIGAEKSYFPTTKPIKLSNGNKGFAIPNDEEVPIHYYIEKDELDGIKKIKIPKKEPYYLNRGGTIVSGDSIRFSVPIKHLSKGLKLYVGFSYDWDAKQNEPLHRVYFRGGDIGSANTGIEAKPCKN
jgi:hypothetical protein